MKCEKFQKQTLHQTNLCNNSAKHLSFICNEVPTSLDVCSISGWWRDVGKNIDMVIWPGWCNTPLVLVPPSLDVFVIVNVLYQSHGRNSLFPIFRQSPGWLTVSLLPLHQVADHKGWGEGEYLEQAENMVISAITPLRSLQCVLSVLQGGGGWTLQQAPLQLGEQPPYQTSGWLLSPHSPLCSRARTGPTADGGSVPPPPPQGARRDRRPTNDEETKKVMFNVLVALWNVLVAYWNDLVACWNVLVSFWNVLIASWNFGSNFEMFWSHVEMFWSHEIIFVFAAFLDPSNQP